ncbi:hypothetical protein [Dokdonella soli]|uniref:Uncharacterized protein n=1 Tax=Dokdonella soli TaxID=529810 RepID=A0ABN1IC41_9GAMM
MRGILFLILLLPALACAAPDRAGLIRAWETELRRDGPLDALPDGSYHFKSEALGYDGHVRVLTAIVHEDARLAQVDAAMLANGTVDFELADLSAEQGKSMGLMSWKAERQNFVFDRDKQAWSSMAEWSSARYSDHAPSGIGAWLRDNAVIVLLVALLAMVFWMTARQFRKARGLLAESGEVNRMGRENIERAGQLRDAQAAAMRESLDLARRNAETLEAILLELRRHRN